MSTSSTTRIYLLVIVSLVALALLLALGDTLGSLGNFEMPERIDPLFLAGALLCTLLYWAVSAIAWQEAVFLFSGIRLPFLYGFSQIALVLIGKYLPGKVWGMAIRGRDLTNMGVSGYQAVISSQAEQIINMHAGLVLGSAGWLLKEQPAYWQGGLVLVILTVVLGAFLNNHMVNTLLGFYKKLRKQAAFEKYAISFRQYLILFCFYLVEWLLIGAILCLLWLTVFDPATSLGNIGYVLAVNALAFVAGFIVIFAPGGIGIREGVLVAMLATVMGVPEAIYLSLLYRIWLVLADSLAGLAAIKILAETYRQSPG